MAVRYTEEQLNTVDKSLLIQMVLNQQEQLETLTAEVRSLNRKMQLMMEQMVLAIQLTMINVYLRYNVFQMAGNLSRFPAFLLPKNEDNV